MSEKLSPNALVTVRTLRPWGGVDLERFEVPFETRPMYINNSQLYSLEYHKPDVNISTMCRSAPIDVATWLHRQGVWDQLPRQ